MDLKDRLLLLGHMRDLDEMRVLRLAVELRSRDVPPGRILAVRLDALSEIDALYKEGRYFMADLIMAGHILKSVMTKVLDYNAPFGRVALEPSHREGWDVSHKVTAEVLRQSGFEVRDLSDVACAPHIAGAAEEPAPDIIVLSDAPEHEAAQRIGDAGLPQKTRAVYFGSVMECLRGCHTLMLQSRGR